LVICFWQLKNSSFLGPQISVEIPWGMFICNFLKAIDHRPLPIKLMRFQSWQQFIFWTLESTVLWHCRQKYRIFCDAN
jgi:hypothetical protein